MGITYDGFMVADVSEKRYGILDVGRWREREIERLKKEEIAFQSLAIYRF